MSFLVIYLKHVAGLMAIENLTGAQKVWEITRENGHKREYDEFLGITLKDV